MKVTALGTGDAFSAERYSSCLLVETPTTKVLVDCPHPIRKILRESTGGRVDIGDIDAVILTHLHADHASGLEPYAWFQRFVLQRPTTLYAHPTVLAAVWPQLHSSMEELLVVDADNHPHHREHLSFADLFDPKPLSTTAPVQIGDLSVESRITIHHIPTTAPFFDADVDVWLLRRHRIRPRAVGMARPRQGGRSRNEFWRAHALREARVTSRAVAHEARAHPLGLSRAP